MKKPCLSCQRILDPCNCEDKSCRLWRRWFIDTWDELRMQYRLGREEPPEWEGTVIGGQRYALPHRVHSYVSNDPCDSCRCPRDLCAIPCRMKRQWLKTRSILE